MWGMPVALDLPVGASAVAEPGLDNPLLVGLHALSDFAIGLAYVCISATLIYFYSRAHRVIPYRWVVLAFGAFIVACGGTHFMHVALAFSVAPGVLALAASMQALTVVASVATALVLPPLVPKVLALIEAARLSEERKRDLEAAHRELEHLYGQLKQLDDFKTQLFANVSHELRTPLTLVLAPARRLLADPSLDAAVHSDLETIERNALALLKQVNDLLDVARLDADKMMVDLADVDVAQLVRVTAAQFEVLAHERDLVYQVETPPSMLARTDSDKVQRILLNLLSNAFKFTPDGGEITCRLDGNAAWATLVVEDNGPGVPPELRDAVFERFRQADGGATRRAGGTGLGLAIVKELTELLGGTVRLTEARGGGARFAVELPGLLASGEAESRESGGGAPAAEAEAAARPILEALRPARYADRAHSVGADGLAMGPADERLGTVLVVEDNRDMNRFLADVLRTEYNVMTAFDGQQGLAMAIAQRPDLILTDIMMPGVSGDQLVRAVRDQPSLDGVPIVVLSAKADDALRVTLLDGAVQDYLVKPFAAEELLARVRNLMTVKLAQDVLRDELDAQGDDLVRMSQELATRNHELARALEARDDFLSGAAHELKTPATTLLLQAQLLERRAHREPALASELSRIELLVAEAVRLKELSIELLDASRADQGRLVGSRSLVDLSDLVGEVCQRHPSDRHPVRLNVEKGLMGQYDRGRVEQLLDNLLDNAMKYSPDGGEILVQLDAVGNEAQLVVSDHGIGIPPDDLPHVFERFRRGGNVDDRRFAGMGLGLYLCCAIVEQHDGRIWASSPGVGQGTSIHVVLPLATGAALVRADTPPHDGEIG